MNMFRQLIDKLKNSPKTIVFTEGVDSRILEASSRLLASSFLTPILIGNPDAIYESAEESGFNIRGANIIDPDNFEDFDKMVDVFMELRREKGATEEEARTLLRQNNYFGTMLVKMGYADCLLGGATYSTADTVRPALQLIKTKPNNKIVSSCFILVRALSLFALTSPCRSTREARYLQRLRILFIMRFFSCTLKDAKAFFSELLSSWPASFS